MILQRMAQAIRRQNWFQVIIEIFIVVIGIFLGLQVTEWNDTRQDKALAVSQISLLAEDAETSKEFAVRQLEGVTRRREGLDYILNFKSGEDDAESLRQHINRGLFSLSSLRSNFTAFEALKTSGGISKLDRPDIIASWNRIISYAEGIRRVEEDTERFQNGITDIFAMKNMNDELIRGSYKMSIEDIASLFELLENQEFRNIVSFQLRIMRGNQNSLERIIGEYEMFLMMLEAAP